MLLTLSFLVATTPKKVATITVNQLYQYSKLIVMAEVESITFVTKTKIATAKILKTYKGKPTGQTVKFVAQETWACDISNATKGEKVFLYLVPTSDSVKDDGVDAASRELASKGITLYSIGHAGRGRLPIVQGGSTPSIAAEAVEKRNWSVNLNLEVPDGKFVTKTDPSKGLIRIADLVRYQ